jgi:hypothetical protein
MSIRLLSKLGTNTMIMNMDWLGSTRRWSGGETCVHGL